MDMSAGNIMVAGRETCLDTDQIDGLGENAKRSVAAFLTRIDAHAQAAKAAIGSHREASNDIAFYHDYHVEECGENVAGRTPEEMMDRLVPVAVWFCQAEENEDDWNASIDYSLGEHVTDYLMTARMNAAGEVLEVAMES